MMKKITIVGVLLLLGAFCWAQSSFTRGQEIFMQNNPAQALSFLERAISEDPSNVTAYLYLGIVYEQLGRMDEAIAIYRRILPSAGNLSANVAFNLGNLYLHRGVVDEAERYYTQAIGFDSVYSVAYLNRANTRISAGNLSNAIPDYERYLQLEPASSQRSDIEALINLIRSEIAAEEMRRIIAEEEAIRVAEERQRLLDSISASLQSAADYSQSISSGADSVELYDGAFVLD